MQFVSDVLAQGAVDSSSIRHALSAMRTHLGMAVAYVSEFEGEETVFREVDAPGLEAVIKPGDRMRLDDVYCRHILEGRLPELIPDTSQNAFAQTLPITKASQIGAHMSVPIRLEDGSVHGMFCCLNFSPDPSLTQRDLAMMRVFADMTARQVGREASETRERRQRRGRVESVLREGGYRPVFQPIFDFATQRPIGFEALTRFTGEPRRTPDIWFAEAEAVGLGPEMELATIEAALAASAALPEGIYVSLNASPCLLLGGQLGAVFERHRGRRIVMEVTEHAPVPCYDELDAALARLRLAHGVRVAIDDAGAGYAGLQHMVRLRPDIIKLDIALVRSIDTDSARRALVSAMTHFARETGCLIIAEGVETAAEMAILRSLGVGHGQGYLMGRPVGFDTAMGLLGLVSV